MMINIDKKLLKQALIKWGEPIQLIMVMEEASELTKEISKYFRGENNRKNIIEEVGDVYIMLEQMKIIFNINDNELDANINKKMKKLEEKLQI
jgi:NTP pyrophosphatase (non-canonical NTP hydrolase)